MQRRRRLILLALPVALLAGACAGRSGGVGEPLSEQERITAEVWRIIADQEGLVAEDLDVETDGGVVVISGVQPELEPVSDLLRRVARVRGVTEVVNRIRIVRGRGAGRPRGSPRDLFAATGEATPQEAVSVVASAWGSARLVRPPGRA